MAVLEGFFSFVASAMLTGIVFAKISRPTRLSRQIIFSSLAVINKYGLLSLFLANFIYRVTPNFFGDPRTLIGGVYQQPQYHSRCSFSSLFLLF